jgi:hypothetical protein
MMKRILLCGFCSMAIHVGGSVAQTTAPSTVAPSTESPVASKPAVVDETSKTPSKIPEIIRRPDGRDNVSPSPTPADPASALKPPMISLRFLRAIRLNWDVRGNRTNVARKPLTDERASADPGTYPK